MSEKRNRKSNWSSDENELLEKALQHYGRNEYQKIHKYIEAHLPNFDREEKDVKKKIYNFLQENIFHEARVKIKTQYGYSLLMIYLNGGDLPRTDDRVVSLVAKFCGHDMKRLTKNWAELIKDKESALNILTVLPIIQDVMKEEQKTLTDMVEPQQYYTVLKTF